MGHICILSKVSLILGRVSDVVNFGGRKIISQNVLLHVLGLTFFYSDWPFTEIKPHFERENSAYLIRILQDLYHVMITVFAILILYTHVRLNKAVVSFDHI